MKLAAVNLDEGARMEGVECPGIIVHVPADRLRIFAAQFLLTSRTALIGGGHSYSHLLSHKRFVR